MVETRAECGRYVILKTIGEDEEILEIDLLKVKCAVENGTNRRVALKILKSEKSWLLSHMKNESSILKELDHPNVIKCEFLPATRYKKKSGEEITRDIIVTELTKCDFFNVISASAKTRGKGLSEKITRAFFRQLVEAVEYCHGKGVVHRDIKPENILLDAEYNVKLANFRWATILDSKQHFTTVGTQRYWAPEIFLMKPFELAPTDIFSLGILLFMMRIGAPPFGEATLKNPDYVLYNKRPDIYWEQISKNKICEEGLLTEEFKVLLEGMFSCDPKQRYTIADIKKSKWYQGEIADKTVIEEEFELLRETLADISQQEKKERERMRRLAPAEIAEMHLGEYR